MLQTGIIWKKCWLVLVLCEFGNYAYQKDDSDRYTLEKQDCKEIKIKSTTCMNCSSPIKGQIKVRSVPVGLQPTLKCLYMHNLLWWDAFDKSMFNAYPDLTHLYMIKNGFGFEVKTNIFESLTNLLHLNLSYTNIVDETVFTLPKSIQTLDYTKLKITSLPIENLHALELLVLSRTRLQDFPRLHDLAPLELVVLHFVNMTNFKIDEFAKYCNLQAISTYDMSLGNDNCKCLQLLEWTKKYNIKVRYPPTCTPDSKCSLEFSQASLKNRDACLAKTSHKGLYLIIAGAILLLLLILGLAIYLHRKLRKQEEEEGIEYVDGHIEIHKPVKEKTGEEEATPDEETLNEKESID